MGRHQIPVQMSHLCPHCSSTPRSVFGNRQQSPQTWFECDSLAEWHSLQKECILPDRASPYLFLVRMYALGERMVKLFSIALKMKRANKLDTRTGWLTYLGAISLDVAWRISSSGI